MTPFFPLLSKSQAVSHCFKGRISRESSVSLISVDWVTVLSADMLQANFGAAQTAACALEFTPSRGQSHLEPGGLCLR